MDPVSQFKPLQLGIDMQPWSDLEAQPKQQVLSVPIFWVIKRNFYYQKKTKFFEEELITSVQKYQVTIILLVSSRSDCMAFPC